MSHFPRLPCRARLFFLLRISLRRSALTAACLRRVLADSLSCRRSAYPADQPYSSMLIVLRVYIKDTSLTALSYRAGKRLFCVFHACFLTEFLRFSLYPARTHCIGSVTVNRIFSFSLCARIVPPCSSTISFAIARPSPTPPACVPLAVSTR